MKLKCENCGKEFDRHPSQVSEHNYCSPDCYREARWGKSKSKKSKPEDPDTKWINRKLKERKENYEKWDRRYDGILALWVFVIICTAISIIFQFNYLTWRLLIIVWGLIALYFISSYYVIKYQKVSVYPLRLKYLKERLEE